MGTRPLTGWLVCFSLLLGGCGGDDGPEMGDVTGLVTLDGQPLPKASVRFVPENASPSIGITDDEGRYELQYSSSRNGAIVGMHTVRISTHRNAGEDDDGNRTPAVPEKVPAEYNTGAAENPDMKREVKPDANEINFELKSGGQIVQPAPSDG